MAGMWMNTGEGGLSPYHLEGGCDVVFQIGTAKFGVRDDDGNLDEGKLADMAAKPQVKMFELKLSQGAKPGKGGILPAAKITYEIAAIRGLPKGRDGISPNRHKEAGNTEELLDLIDLIRLVTGKPVGIKTVMGDPQVFTDLFTAMKARGENHGPDFITLDGGEGGTGAAPLEFANSVGSPLADALPVVDDLLVQYGLRDEIKIIASGRILTAFNMAQRLSMGADICNSARGMMMALGCIQALRCNTNACPVGVATQDKHLVAGLVVEHKRTRVANFQRETVHTLMELCAAAGLTSPADLTRFHINRRISSTETRTYAGIYGPGRMPNHLFELGDLDPGELESRLELLRESA